MSNDPTNNTDDNMTIDELASRFVDREIDLADIPTELRAAVESRVAQFMTNRERLLTSLPHADGSTIDRAVNEALRSSRTQSMARTKSRKFGVYIGSLAAAAAVVAVVGVAVTQSGSTDESVSDMAVAAKISPEVAAAPMASEAPAESFSPMIADSAVSGAKASLIINDTNELQDLVSEWSVEGFVVPQKSEPLCDDPLRPAIDVEATFAGELAEIHFSIADGIVVYRIDSCDMMGGIVP
jgi:hypothetical protein